MGTIVNEIYWQVTEDLKSESNDGLQKIADTFYGIDSKKYSRSELIDRIASIEVGAYLK